VLALKELAVLVLTVVAINILNHRLWDSTLHRIFIALPQQLAAAIAHTTRIECSLQRIALPAEYVVAMITVAGSAFIVVSSGIVHPRFHQRMFHNTYASPMENTNGCVPFAPHNSS
jgi:hypothetical protein